NGNGADAINVVDNTATFSNTYTITSTTLARVVFGGLTYGNIGSLTLDAETGDNIINVNSANPSTALTLNGGAGNDTYAYLADSALGSDTITDPSGTDTISFVGTSTAVTLDLSQTTQQTVNANLKITLSSSVAIENLTGGSGND